MSETLKPWLFPHCATQTSSALSANFDLHDMPYLPGNRVQILRFLTFPPSACDAWAIVGDRTHCLAARFSSASIARFSRSHPVSFTSLRGALLTLTHVSVRVGRIAVQGGSGGSSPYRDGQYALYLDVRGFQVVSSVKEPVWYSSVKLVTSPNGVPQGQGEAYGEMVRWMKRWIRYKCLLRKAREERKRKETRAEAVVEEESGGARGGLPTPAQRKTVLVVSSSQLQPQVQERPVDPQEEEEESFATIQGATQREADAMWTGFDLDADAEVDLDDIQMGEWGAVDADVGATSSPAAAEVTAAGAAGERIASQQATQTQTQSQAGEDLDPDESGLSDYERQSRVKRRRLLKSKEEEEKQPRAAVLPPPAMLDDPAREVPAPQQQQKQQEQRASGTAGHKSSPIVGAPAGSEPASPPASSTSSRTAEAAPPAAAPSTSVPAEADAAAAAAPAAKATESATAEATTTTLPPAAMVAAAASATAEPSTVEQATTTNRNSTPPLAPRSQTITNTPSTDTTSKDSAPRSSKHKRANAKRERRQAALAALMAQIVD